MKASYASKLSKGLRTALAVVALAPVTLTAGPNFDDVWSKVKGGQYGELPEHPTTLRSFFSGLTNKLAESAGRTLDDHADILEPFQKLVHPVGICFAGTWRIDSANEYTGYFAEGTKARIIVRASEAMGNPRVGDYRSFGFAGKIFPNADTSAENTANFFTVDDLGGALAASYLDDAKSNKPLVSVHLNQFAIFPMVAFIAKTFKAADADPGIRQVYEISELGLNDPSRAVTPQLMKIAAETTTRVEAADFRQELRLNNYANGLKFGIWTSDDGQVWNRLGQIHLTEQALSFGCDHQLHFHHPRSK